jgi:DNA replication and checkpoint protein
MHTVHLIDTPKRSALAAHSTSLRTKLKQWEKSFAASHSGQKPGREDIKACLEIAKTYKEYNRVRDVLDGKLGVESLDDAVKRSPTAGKGGRRKHGARKNSSETEARGDAAYVPTPRKASRPPHQGPNVPFPNLLDSYDPPSSASPRRYLVTAIGPTPQRDGKVLGLFDLLSNSGRSSQATPSTRKRKIDILGDDANRGVGGSVIEQTPSRKRTRVENDGGDLLDHLDDSTPRGHQRHSRTPTSEGKKFMLSQFFATPSTMRFAAIAGGLNETLEDQAVDRVASAQQTPLRTHVLGSRVNRTGDIDLPALDATPAYLKRSCSFKDRLLSVSASTTGATEFQKTNLLTGPPTLRRYKCGPKPLSEIVRGLRQMEDEQHDDDLDALREMESARANVLVGDSQATETGAGTGNGSMGVGVEAGEENRAFTKVWRKKGQKRTTRRANMRPVKMKPKKENQWVAEDSGSEDGVGSEAVEEMQQVVNGAQETLNDGEEQYLGEVLSSHAARAQGSTKVVEDHKNDSASGSSSEFEDNSDRGELDDYEEGTGHKVRGKRICNNDSEAKTTKSTREKGKDKDTGTADKAKQKKRPTINPNAVSHQNFRSLKIRNKNSKAKGGRGRFGRKGR